MTKRMSKKNITAIAAAPPEPEIIAPKIKPKTIVGYHRTNKTTAPHSIAYQGFDHSKCGANGSTYGSGFYMSLDLPHHVVKGESYGEVIIQSSINMEKVLILDIELSEQVWGQPKTLLQQFLDNNIAVTSTQLAKLIIWSRELLQQKGETSSRQAGYLKNAGLLESWAGLQYSGRTDGPCLVMYESKQVFPEQWSEISKDLRNKVYKKFGLYGNEDDDSWPNVSATQQKNVSTFIIEKLEWKTLNKQEVLRIRNGMQTRFYRWLEHFYKLPKTKAQHRFNLLLSSVSSDNFHLLVEDINKFGKHNKEQYNFINTMLTQVSATSVAALVKNINTDKFIVAEGIIKLNTKKPNWVDLFHPDNLISLLVESFCEQRYHLIKTILTEAIQQVVWPEETTELFNAVVRNSELFKDELIFDLSYVDSIRGNYSNIFKRKTVTTWQVSAIDCSKIRGKLIAIIDQHKHFLDEIIFNFYIPLFHKPEIIARRDLMAWIIDVLNNIKSGYYDPNLVNNRPNIPIDTVTDLLQKDADIAIILRKQAKNVLGGKIASEKIHEDEVEAEDEDEDEN